MNIYFANQNKGRYNINIIYLVLFCEVLRYEAREGFY